MENMDFDLDSGFNTKMFMLETRKQLIETKTLLAETILLVSNISSEIDKSGEYSHNSDIAKEVEKSMSMTKKVLSQQLEQIKDTIDHLKEEHNKSKKAIDDFLKIFDM